MAMEWSREYTPERTASWDEAAEYIRASVTMPYVLSVYCPDLPRRHFRCPCPLHNGKDYNFSFTNIGYKCFVCGASGDVISFVKDILRMSTRADAIRRINEDLHLNIPLPWSAESKITESQLRNLKDRLRKAQEKRQAQEDWWRIYHYFTDEWIKTDREISENEPMSYAWAAAVKRREYLEHCLRSLPEEPR